MLRALPLAVLLLAILPGGAAAQEAVPADEPVASLAGGGRIDAFGGVLAWTTWNVAEGRAALTLRTAIRPEPRQVTEQREAPFDLSVGPDATGRAVVTFSRGGRARVLDPRTFEERALRGVTGTAASPAVWGDVVAWVRPGRCDRLYVKVGRGRGLARPVGRECLAITDLEVRGRRIALRASMRGQRIAHMVLRMVTLRAGADDVRTVASARWGEEPRPLGPPVLDAGANVTFTRYGLQVHRFVRVRPTGRIVSDVPAAIDLAGPVALDGGRWHYVALGRGEEGCGPGPQSQLAPVPCVLVTAARSPFSLARRLLPPELSVDYEPGCPAAGAPLTVTGRLTRSVVETFDRVGTVGIPGATVSVLRRTDVPAGPGFAESFTPAGPSATTDAEGRWEVQLPAPAGEPYFSAVTGELLAGRGTVGYACTR